MGEPLDFVLPDKLVINNRGSNNARQETRVKGGAGLIILQVAAVHDSTRCSSNVLMAIDDSCMPGYEQMADICHRYGAVVFGQLFHPGREIKETADGVAAVVYSSAATPQKRFHVMPRELSKTMIAEVNLSF